MQLFGYQKAHALDYDPEDSARGVGQAEASEPSLFVRSSGVLVHGEVCSPSGSGQRAVLTNALDALATYDVFWDELLDLLGKPLKLAESEREFVVTEVLDGKMLESRGMGNGSGQDDKLVSRFVVDRESGCISSSHHDSAGNLVERNFAVLHRGPLRLEWWGELPGKRRSGPLVASQTRARLEGALGRCRPGEDLDWRGVQVSPDVSFGPASTHRRVVAGPLDHLADFDGLWGGWVADCRDGTGLREQTDDLFSVRGEEQFAADGQVMPCVHSFTLTKAAGQIYSETHSTTGRLLERRWVVISRRPLQVESWAEGPGERCSGRLKRAMVQNLVDTVAGRIRGTTSKVGVYFDMASPGSPGVNSIVSEPMSGRLSFGTLWDAWLAQYKSPPGLDRVVKNSDLAVVSDCEFKITHTLDQDKLKHTLDLGAWSRKPWTLMQSVDDFVKIRYLIDEAAGSIFAETYGRSGRVRDRSWGVLHREPFVLEWWGEHPGTRKSGVARERMLQSYLNALASRLPGGAAGSAPKAHREAKSPSTAGLKSVVSDPLEELGDVEKLWDELVFLVKRPPNAEVVRVDVRQLNVMDDDRISASSFDVVRRNADGTTSVIKCEVDRGRRLCSLMTCGESGRILERDYVQLHQNPLVLEWWGEERGERRHGPVKAQQLQAMLDVVIERLGCAKSSDDGASDSTEYASAGSATDDSSDPGTERPSIKATVSLPSVASKSADDKSSLSQPLDGVADWKAFWEELISCCKHPVKELVPYLRSSDLDEVSASEFYVSLNTAAPALQYIAHVKHDKAHGVFSAESFGNDESEPEKMWALFNKEPLVIESWGEQKIARGFGAARCEQIRALLDTVVRRVRPGLGRSGVRVTSDEKMRCAVSSPLDAILDFDRLWNELIELLKRPVTQGVLKEATLKVGSDTEFTVVHTLDGASLPRPEAEGEGKGKGTGVDDVKTILTYRVDKSRGEVYRDCYRMSGGLIDRGWIMVRTEPLRLESWTETPSWRQTGRHKARVVQDILDGAVGLSDAACGRASISQVSLLTQR